MGWLKDRDSVGRLRDVGWKEVQYVALLGWDADAKKLVYRKFDSNGDTWSGEWTEFIGDIWKGKGSGVYRGVEWNSEATLKLAKDSQRNQDVTDQKPWIAV